MLAKSYQISKKIKQQSNQKITWSYSFNKMVKKGYLCITVSNSLLSHYSAKNSISTCLVLLMNFNKRNKLP